VINDHIDELNWYMNVTSLEQLELDFKPDMGYTFKTMAAGFWALRQRDFRQAIQAITMEVCAEFNLIFVLNNVLLEVLFVLN
jgi:hypothetical protein